MTEGFSKLYKKNTRGDLLVWSIEVDGNTITTRFGQLGGAIQTTVDVISSGKNIGKSNETTPEEQALAEARASHLKQLKSGYVDDAEKAEKGEVSSVIKGGILPMLAHKYRDHSAKIKFPCAVQPKLDGIRCVAVKEDGEFTLWTRTRKQIHSLPHIVEALNLCFKSFPNGKALDGEAYTHAYKSDFEKIVSAVRKDTPSEDSLKIQYHIYDCTLDGTFENRLFALQSTDLSLSNGALIRVDTALVPIEEEIRYWESVALDSGYEGCMVRNINSPYENKRSYNLQKVVIEDSAEFEVVGVEEGRGKLAGLVGAFKLVTKEGKEFNSSPMGAQEDTRKYIQDPSLCVGKTATIKYRGVTDEGIPRFGKLVAFRDYE